MRSEEDRRRARAILAGAFGRQGWTFAKTMPESPHWYALRRDWSRGPGGHGLSFDAAVAAIRTLGFDRQWGGRTYRYLRLAGFDYWTMGAPIPETTLVNRAEAVYPSTAYDDLAPGYDALFDRPEYRAEEAALRPHLDLRGRVLDVGCGTGSVVLRSPDAERITDYTGIDPSLPMLREARRLFPESLTRRFRASTLADWSARRASYDRVLLLFGVGSYVDPATVLDHALPWVRPGGRLVVMRYAPGYRPETHRVAAQNAGAHDPPPVFSGPGIPGIAFLGGKYVLSVILNPSGP